MKGIPDQSIDFICTDLPYGTTNAKFDKTINLEKMWEHFLRISKPKTAIVLFAQGAFTADVINSNRKMFKYDLVYHKTHKTNYLNSRLQFLRQHESILVFYRKQPTYNPIMEEGIRKVVKKEHRKTNKSTIYNSHSNYVDYDSTERYPASILKVKSDRQKEALHQHQKPVQLMEYLISTFMNKNSDEVVLDATMGSASTIIAAINCGVNFIGIEKDPEIFDVAKYRIKKHLKEKDGSI